MSESLREEVIPDVLPRGRNATSRSVVRTSQHNRLVAAMIELAARKGYPNVTIAELVTEAGVAKPTFYEHFSDKESCFVEAFELSVEAAGAAITESLSPDDPVEQRIAAGLTALLRFFAEDDSRARLMLIESLKAGPAVASAVTDAHRRFAALYVLWREESRRQQPDLAPLSLTRGLCIVGALNEPVMVMLRDHHASKIMELEDELKKVTKALALA